VESIDADQNARGSNCGLNPPFRCEEWFALVNRDLLNIPHGCGAYVNCVGVAAIDRVDQVAGVFFAVVLTGDGHAENFSSQIHLIDFAGGAVASEQVLGRTVGDAH